MALLLSMKSIAAGKCKDRCLKTVATARQRGAVLVTKDQRIRQYGHVHSLW